MQRKLISVAVTAALSAAAGSSFALTPAQVTALGVANIPQVYMAGATAQNGGIQAVAQRLCATGSLDQYSTPSNAQRVFICNARNAIGTVAAGSAIAIHKESSGGSANGISPLTGNTTKTFIDISSIASCATTAAVAAVAPVAPDTLGLPAYQPWNCPATVGSFNITPDIGFSDVDPPVFGLASSGVGGTLNLLSPNQLIFGVAVTKAMRNALQTAQGLTVPACGATVEAVGCQPSLSHASVAGIMSGNIHFSDFLGDAAGAEIFLVRRGATSGSQKTAEVIFLNGNITAGTSTTSAMPTPSAGGNSVAASDTTCGTATVNPASGFVFAGTNADAVVNCLLRHDSAGRYALGVVSSEWNQTNPTLNSSNIETTYNATGAFRFIKLDGYMPTISNVIRGKYDYFSEQVITARTTIAGVPAALLTAINAQLADPNVLSSINRSYTVWTDAPLGEQTTGLLAPARSTDTVRCQDTNTFAVTTGRFTTTPTAAGITAGTDLVPDLDPVNYMTKNPTGTKVNNAIKPAIAICPPRYAAQ